MPSRKGIPNKKKMAFREALRKYCDDLNVDPHYWMADLLAKRRVKAELKLQAAKELAQYLEPKLKSVEVIGDPERPLYLGVEQLTPEERVARIEELWRKRQAGQALP